MKEIYLSNGLITQIDDIDFLYALGNRYYAKYGKNSIYARRWKQVNHYKYSSYLHQDIISRMGLIVPKGHQIDHEDRNGLNNQRYNLRIVTKSHNIFNAQLKENNTSSCAGVVLDKNNNKWVAKITKNKINIILGSYEDLNDAIEARRQGELKYYGEIIS